MCLNPVMQLGIFGFRYVHQSIVNVGLLSMAWPQGVSKTKMFLLSLLFLMFIVLEDKL